MYLSVLVGARRVRALVRALLFKRELEFLNFER
jgi:hypothetical protein